MNRNPVNDQDDGSGWGWRHVQVLTMFLATCSAITMRVCLSVTIVVMTGQDRDDGQPRFDWQTTEKSMVLGSFLWGYMLSQVLGGFLSSRGWAVYVLMVAFSVSGALTAALPWVAVAGGSAGVAVLRMLSGVFQGSVFPTLFGLLGKWVPPDERSRAGSLLLASQPVGTVVSMALSGWITFAWGWPSVFYVFGLSGFFASLALFVLTADSPEVHPRMSFEEREYLKRSIGNLEQKTVPVPWRAILSSSAVWSLMATHVAYLSGYWVIITCTPSYLNNLLDIGIEWNGLISAAPHLSMGLCSLFFGWLGDVVGTREMLSLSLNRKLFNTIGEWGPGLLCVLIGAFGANYPILAVSLLVIACGLISATFSGEFVNFVDIAPNFSGITFGIANTVGAFVSAFAPYLEGVLVDPADPLPGWSNVFYVTAASYLVLNSIWLVYGTAQEQSWNSPVLLGPGKGPVQHQKTMQTSERK